MGNNAADLSKKEFIQRAKQLSELGFITFVYGHLKNSVIPLLRMNNELEGIQTITNLLEIMEAYLLSKKK